ncbi:BQ2448_5840 [Microbotryum intermedium]|uniref:BQ2448_5840 protein n=1 Tax=Microbotryum intermedium TaxID=269621 RepID=A0A238F5T6_9BASI|nr:BQ2448_5840 [Microbotryum intermedium]
MLVPVTTADPILLTAGEPIDYYSYEHIVRNAHGGLVLIELQTSNFGLTGAESSSAQTLSRIAGVVKQFAFGDSYTASGYNPANGINNITYFGNTSSNGLNWFQYLALSNPNVNASRQLFDFAQFGATTSNAIVPSSAPDLVDQVIEFHKFFVPPPPQAPWLSKDTLFTIWISINDVGFGFIQNISYADAQPRINKTWVDVINTLYSYGARNFLVLGVPPTERTPLVQSYNATNITTFGENVNKYNAMLTSFIPWIPLSYPGTRAMLFDTQPFLNALLDDPYRYGFVDATDVCPAYEYVSGDPFVNSPLCPWPFTEMTWASSYHPTWPVHRLLAQVILNALQTAQSGGVIDSGETVLMNGSTASIEPTYIPIAVPTVTSSRSVANPTVAFTTAVVAGSTGVIAGRPPGKTSSASYTLRFNVLRAPMGPVLLLASCAAAVLMLGSMPSR